MSDARIDGRPVRPHAGETILAAAARMGIEIPALCHARGLTPEGTCRLCMVEVEGSERLQAACHTALRPGMRVWTATTALERLRRDVLGLFAGAHPDACFRPDPDGTELERWMARYGVDRPERTSSGESASRDASHPYLRFDPARCILCRRCVRVCNEIEGRFVFGIEGRGGRSRLIVGENDRLASSDCAACGACVDRCPTGALLDVDRLEPRSPDRVTRSVCGYCGVGCAVQIESAAERVLRVGPVTDAPVNRGHLCVKGRYAHAYQHSRERLTQPQLRDGGAWRSVSWPEALEFAARRLGEVRDRYGGDALGAFTSARASNESVYLLQRLFRTRLDSNNVDCSARLCQSSTEVALRAATGIGAGSASFADIERAGCILLAGSNATEAHPVLGARIKRAVLSGTTLVVVDPRRIDLADYADAHLQLRPGTNVPLLNALARVLVDEELYDADYVRERCTGLEELVRFLLQSPLASASAISGVEARQIRDVGQLLGRAGPTLFVHGQGLSELRQGVGSVMALCNLALLTGSFGRPGAGLLPLGGQANARGNVDVGGGPDRVAGHQPLDDHAVRQRLAELWGTPPPARRGRTILEMLEAVPSGGIRGLWIQGGDVAHSHANEERTRRALEQLELLVVQELFPSETTRYAHLVLPAAAPLEQDGTFTNGERRVQRVRPAVAPPGEARPDWEVIRDLGHALGAGWSYAHPSEVFDEIARVAPDMFGGLDYARLEGGGVQWPCPEPDHPGTERLHAAGFARGRGRLLCVPHVASPEHAVEGFPYTLITGRVLEHHNVGSMTRRTPNAALEPDDRLAIHPSDAVREGLADGARVELESRWGRTRVRIRVSDRVAPGQLFLSFHYPETHANRLTGPQLDPESHCPEYKLTALRLRRAP